MSQEKVDQYKKEKKNRKANMKKAKRHKKLWKIFGPVLAVLIVALIGAGIYFIPRWTNQKVEESQTDQIDYDQLMQMLNQSAGSISTDSTDSTESTDSSGSADSTGSADSSGSAATE